MEAKHLEEFTSIDVGGYTCKLRALSVGAYEALAGGALTYVSAQNKEDVVIDCLVSPTDLIDAIHNGSIEAGIPLSIYDYIVSSLSMLLHPNVATQRIEEARVKIGTSVIESCRVLILAAGIMTLEEIKALSISRLYSFVALAERVLDIRQQNFGAGVSGGEAIKLTLEVADPKKSKLLSELASKEEEVQELLNMQAPRGMRRL